MTTTEIVLLSVLGSVGYLTVGLVTIGVGSARQASSSYTSQIATLWWWALIFWPAILAFVLAYALLFDVLSPSAKWITLKIAKKLNPRIKRWEPFEPDGREEY